MASKNGSSPKENFNPDKTVFTPPDVSAMGVRQIEFIKKNMHKAIPIHIAGMQQYVPPLLPGVSMAVIAQTSNFKSGFFDGWQNWLAGYLKSRGRTKEVIVHVSTEETIEEQAYRMLGRGMGVSPGSLARGDIKDSEWDRLTKAAIEASQVPIFRISASLENSDYFPKMNMTNIILALDYLQKRLVEDELKIGVIFFDYLQDFDLDENIQHLIGKDQRRLQVKSDITRIFHAGRYFGCPTITGVQAKQKLDGAPSKKLYIPGVYDGEETSGIGQKMHRVLTMWMPKTVWPVGSEQEHGDIWYKVSENLLFIKVAKQRAGLPAGKIFACRIDFQTNMVEVEPMPGVDPFNQAPPSNGNGAYTSTKQL